MRLAAARSAIRASSAFPAVAAMLRPSIANDWAPAWQHRATIDRRRRRGFESAATAGMAAEAESGKAQVRADGDRGVGARLRLRRGRRADDQGDAGRPGTRG